MSDELLARIARLEKRLERERARREQAERIAEQTTSELYDRLQELERTRDDSREAEARVSISEQRWRALVDNTNDVILVLDERGTVVFVSNAGRDPRAAAAIGVPIVRLLPAERVEVFEQLLSRVRASGESLGYEAPDARTGEYRHIKIVPMKTEGLTTSFILIVADVTEQKRAEVALRVAKEQAEAASEAKGAFLANMSHEIRTPLNAIIGLAYLAQRMQLEPKVLRYLRDIHAAGTHLLGLVNDVLDFSKLSAGKLALDDEPFLLESVLQRVMTMLRPRAQAKELELVVAVEPTVPQTLSGDPLRLAQILINYVGNAVKFTERGTIAIVVRVLERTDASALLEFRVTDTGPGLTAEQQGRLFRDFEQVDGSHTRTYAGTGLGLAISRRLAEQMGGTVGVESRVGEGSSFWFTARLGVRAGSEMAAPSGPLVGRRVLVADDNDVTRRVLVAKLVALGCQTTSVSSGLEAVERVLVARVSGDPFDALVTDWRMPGVDGLEAVRRLRAALPPDAMPRAILVTARSPDDEALSFDSLGIDCVLSKPVDSAALRGALTSALVPSFEGLPADVETSAETFHESLRGARVLVVDDAEVNREIARSLLEVAGGVVEVACDGREALTVLAAAPFDLVLMDMQMPEMDGISATIELRKRPDLDRVPVLAMTANVLPRDRERCLAAGMQAVLTKPIDPPEFYTTIAWHLHRVRLGGGGSSGRPKSASSVPPAPVAPVDQPPLLDMERAVRNLAGNRALFARIARKFVAAHGDDLRVARTELAERRSEDAQRTLHTLKGLAGSLGALRLQSALLTLETSVREGRVSLDDPASLDDLASLLAATVQELEARLASLA